MPGNPTPILGLIVPTVGGDANLWGQELNNNWAIIDQLGALAIISVSFSQAVPVFPFPEVLVRVNTGALTITVTLPAPGQVQGKILTVKKVDSGLGVVNVVAAGGALVEGAPFQIIANQFTFLRFVSNGVSYDIIGQG